MFSDGLFACPVEVLPALPHLPCRRFYAVKKRVGTDRAHVCRFRTGSAGHIRFVCGWVCRVGRRSRKGFVRNRLPPESLPIGPPVRKSAFPRNLTGFQTASVFQSVARISSSNMRTVLSSPAPMRYQEPVSRRMVWAEYRPSTGCFCSSARVADASACGLRTAM